MTAARTHEERCARARAEILEEYYEGDPPEVGAPRCYPIALNGPFEYIEVTVGKKKLLAILTPFEVTAGPGKKCTFTP